MEAYRIEHVAFSYPQQTNRVLDGIRLTVRHGEFVALCGKSGSGKSTLLRHLKTALTPHGEREGHIWFEGELLESVGHRQQSSKIGFVFQHPDNQIVTDKVWHELAFGLESLGYDQKTIRLRVAEMASFFGIHTWFHKQVAELSGGQKQMLNLASVMAMQPAVLVLDEPTSMLDPIAAGEFLDILKKINRDLGTTIILSEHRLEEVVAHADRLVVMDGGRIIADGPPVLVGAALHGLEHPMFAAMPAAMRIVKGAQQGAETDADACPVTVNAARHWLTRRLGGQPVVWTRDGQAAANRAEHVVLQVKHAWFRYDKTSPDVVKDLSFEARQGEFVCIVGGNGTGKTTALSIMGGLLKPYRGNVIVNEGRPARLALLPQNPQNLFVKKTVELDLLDMLTEPSMTNGEKLARISQVATMTELEGLLQRHPYDLSGGEQQRAALAKVLLLEPHIVLLDEPTKGLDAFYKVKLAHIIRQLTDWQVAVVMVSHDIEFCAMYADRCALFFDGGIVTADATRAFFAGNSFYTTSANRIARHLCAEAVTVEDVIKLCGQA